MSICFLFGVKGVLFLVVSSIIWSSEKLVVWFMIWIINGLLVYWPLVFLETVVVVGIIIGIGHWVWKNRDKLVKTFGSYNRVSWYNFGLGDYYGMDVCFLCLRENHTYVVLIWRVLWVIGIDWFRGCSLVMQIVLRIFTTKRQRFQYLVSSNQGIDLSFYIQYMRINGIFVMRDKMEIWDKVWAGFGHYRYIKSRIKHSQEALGFLIVRAGIDMHRREYQNVIITFYGQSRSKDLNPFGNIFWVYGFTGLIKSIINIIKYENIKLEL